MTVKAPASERNLDGYDAPPIAWARVRERLDQGVTQPPGTGGPDRHTYWLATTNPDSSPHVMPLGVFWVEMQFPALLGWNIALHFPGRFALAAATVTIVLSLAGALLPSLRAVRLSVPAALRTE